MILLSFLAATQGLGQGVKEVIERYAAEMGGRASLERISSVQLRGTIEYEDGTTQSVSIIKKRPDKVRLSIVSGEIRITQGYNGSVAWINFEGPGGAVTREMEPHLAQDFIRNAPLENALFDRPGQNVTHALAEDVILGQVDCFHVIARHPDQSYSAHYIDKESWRERRILEFDSSGNLQSEIIPSRFARYGGIDFATRIVRLENGRRVSIMDLIDININPGSLDSAFDPPGAVNPVSKLSQPE
jgi:hypothetical protein